MSDTGTAELKSRCWQNLFSCLFCLPESTRISWLMVAFLKASNIASLRSLNNPISLWPPLSAFKITQCNFFTSTFSITSEKFTLPCEMIYSQGLAIRMQSGHLSVCVWELYSACYKDRQCKVLTSTNEIKMFNSHALIFNLNKQFFFRGFINLGPHMQNQCEKVKAHIWQTNS